MEPSCQLPVRMLFDIGADRIQGAPRKSALAGRRGSSRNTASRSRRSVGHAGFTEGPDQGPKWEFKDIRRAKPPAGLQCLDGCYQLLNGP